MNRVLLIEDDAWLSELYCSALAKVSGLEVDRASSASTALEALDSSKIDLIVLDMFLGEHNGVEFLHEIASYQDTRRIPVIILSAVHKHDFGMQPDRWAHYNVVEYLYKPSTKPDQLVGAVSKQFLKDTQKVTS